MSSPAAYRVSAYNLAKQSENKMHDDAVARQFGFTGGLVPGVDVFAYMSHMPVEAWGRAFLERGLMDSRFLKPVYDGEIANVTAKPSQGGLLIEVESRGELCATGHAYLPKAAPDVNLAEFKSVAPRTTRAPVDARSYGQGAWLGIPPYTQSSEAAAQYIADVRETLSLYAADRLMHPGTLLRTLNWALMENAILGPWIHVGSTVQFVSAAEVGDELTVRAEVKENYERKGHLFVELDGVIVANGRRVVAQCQHTAIYQPRQARAA